MASKVIRKSMAKKKRSAIAAVITAFVMAFTIVPIGSGPAFANEAMSGTCGAGGAVTYSWDGQGTLRIEGNGPMDDMESMWLEPWETKWKEAVPLDEIRTIIIGDGITYIGKYCFEKAGATQLSIGKSVKEIGEGAFQSCSNLEDVAIPDSVAEIGPMAFSNDQNLWQRHPGHWRAGLRAVRPHPRDDPADPDLHWRRGIFPVREAGHGDRAVKYG